MNIAYKVTGLIALTFGVIGAFLPLMPTTCFILVAAWCFAKSSPKWHAKLRNSHVFGGIITSWEHNKVIPERARIIAISSMVISGIYSFFIIENVMLKLSLVSLIAIGIWFVNRYREPSDV